MNKQQAYNTFWNSFGVLAFEENSVPTEDVIETMIKAGVATSRWPMITYQVLIDDLGEPLYPTASIYDRSTSWERADTLANAISASIQKMGTIKLDNGRMFITKGSPYAQHIAEEADRAIRRIIINLGIEFFTEE
jgi:hypothetical protein